MVCWAILQERDRACFGGRALLRGAQGVVVVQVAYLQSVTVQMPVICLLV